MVFEQNNFNDYIALSDEIKKIKGVEAVISIPSASNLIKKDSTQKLKAVQIFPDSKLSQTEIDSCKKIVNTAFQTLDST